MIDIKLETLEQLTARRDELYTTYEEGDIPINAWEFASARVDEALHRSPDSATYREHSQLATRALDQAIDYVAYHQANDGERQAQVLSSMKQELERDIPQHCLLDDTLMARIRGE